jgi:hypothetical protein
LSFEIIGSFGSAGRLLFCDGIRRCNSTSEEIRMNNKLVSCLIAGALGTTLALASPALGRGGGGGHGGGGGGMHGGGMGGGMRSGGMGGGMHVSAMSGGPHFSGIRSGTHFSGGRFAGAHFTHHGFSPRSSRLAFRDHDHFHHRFHHRFAFFGAPYYSYASYNDCWRRVWTSYGPQWVDVCGDYGY